MKKIKHITLGLIFAVSFNSCTDDFEETNTDPNRLETISPATLLNPILYSLTNHNSYSAWHNRTAHFMQGIVPYPSNASGGYHRYDVTDDIGTTMWNNHYKWLKNLDEMEEAAIKANDQNYQAVALTLKAWAYANLTDCFGDIPFSEASKADKGIEKPKFDRQQDIYKSVLEYLEKANGLYNTKQSMIYTADLLYNNDVSKWQKLTNSLHLRLLLRISNIQPTETINKINTILNDPAKYPVFINNTDNAILINTGVTPNTTPWPRIQDYAADKKLSTFLIDNLLQLNDPRITIWATKAKDLKGNDIGYKGIPSGYAFNDSSIKYTPSAPNNVVALAPMKNIVMTYGELQLIKAELAQKGLIPGDAKAFYEDGVKASMEVWGTTISSDYFTNSFAEYNGTLERIMLQKYFTLYFTDNQQWMEFRRTGFPILPLQTNLFNNGKMPIRYPYPPNVKMQNKENYQIAVQQMGGDDINTRVWWDVK
ncbi:SusD/RagB family nutrient-binding outer membrane lipoprotein [Empedobacter tilapiae]